MILPNPKLWNYSPTSSSKRVFSLIFVLHCLSHVGYNLPVIFFSHESSNWPSSIHFKKTIAVSPYKPGDCICVCLFLGSLFCFIGLFCPSRCQHYTVLTTVDFNRSWYIISSVQLLSRVWLFVTPWIAAHQASLSITNSQSLPKLMSIVSNAIQLSHPLLSPSPPAPQSLPASGFFLGSQLFALGGQSTGLSASASILPMNTQDWSPLGWTDWISLQSKGLSRVFSNIIV